MERTDEMKNVKNENESDCRLKIIKCWKNFLLSWEGRNDDDDQHDDDDFLQENFLSGIVCGVGGYSCS